MPKKTSSTYPIVTLSEKGEQMLKEALQDVAQGHVKEHDSVQALLNYSHFRFA